MTRHVLRLVLTVLVLMVPAAAAPAAAEAHYLHVGDCQWALRGGNGDDDIHDYGVKYGMTSFIGWGASGHVSDHEVIIEGYFRKGAYIEVHQWFHCYFPNSTTTIYDGTYGGIAALP